MGIKRLVGHGSLRIADLQYRTDDLIRLGWTPSEISHDNVVFFQCAGVVFGLYGRAALAEDAAPDSAEGIRFRGVALAYNTRSKDEVNAVLALAARAGAVTAKPSEEAFWGGYSGYFADPDRHLWEVAWNPSLVIDGDGHVSLPG